MPLKYSPVLLWLLPSSSVQGCRFMQQRLQWIGAALSMQALPSVVNISVETITTNRGPPQRGRQVGTGFLIDPSGTIVTNRHVIDGAFRMTVTLSDRSQWDAKLVAAAEILDLAVLKIDVGHRLPFLKFANSDTAEVGDPVFVIGNPLGPKTKVGGRLIPIERARRLGFIAAVQGVTDPRWKDRRSPG